MPVTSKQFLLSAVLACGAAMPQGRAATFQTLYSFDGLDAGKFPNALSLASNGKIYGTTSLGGPVVQGEIASGTLFVIGQGKAQPIRTLSSFSNVGSGGYEPESPPTLGRNGVLFGTTFAGGRTPSGYGEIYSFNLHTLTKSVAYGFTPNDSRGFFPAAAMVTGQSGAFFGTASGSTYPGCSCGTVFRFDPVTGHVDALHVFTGGKDGGNPNQLVFNAAGTLLYGTTGGGNSFPGTVFSLDPNTKMLATLHSFAGAVDGNHPLTAVAFDKAGNFYGTASALEPGRSTVFEMAAGTGVFSVVATLPAGIRVTSALTIGQNGLLYGTADGRNNDGYIFSLNPASRALETLHQFRGHPDGFGPTKLVQTRDGTLYGTTQTGGTDITSNGTVFKLVP